MQPGLILSGHDPEPHVTDLGGKDAHDQLMTWMESLLLDNYPAIKAFTEASSFKPTNQLATELETALVDHPPADAETTAAVNLFLDRLGVGFPDETVTVDHQGI